MGGIPHHIKDPIYLFPLSTVEEAAQRVLQLLYNENLRRERGRKSRETVSDRSLLIRLLEQHLDVLDSLETIYRLTQSDDMCGL